MFELLDRLLSVLIVTLCGNTAVTRSGAVGVAPVSASVTVATGRAHDLFFVFTHRASARVQTL